jgi:lipase (class 3)
MSSFTQGYDQAEAQLLITLSELAYLDSDPLPGETVEAQAARMKTDINAALAASEYASWQVVWGPGLTADRANMLYTAGAADTNQIAVAVRGTDWSFWLNWIENFASVLPLVPFTAVLRQLASGTPQIAAGTNLGLNLLLAASGATSTGEQMDIASFVTSRTAGTDTFVTGHSLGGCLASVLAPTLAYELGSAASLKVYTFAAPSAGNDDFVAYFNRLFADPPSSVSTAFRLYNNLDIVPTSWASLPDITDLYVPAPACTQQMKRLIAWAQERVAGEYEQVGTQELGSAIMLQGTVQPSMPLPPRAQALDNAAFFSQVDYQHKTETYMQLLDGPMLPTWVAKLSATLASARLGEM